jgi:hypothetical protein
VDNSKKSSNALKVLKCGFGEGLNDQFVRTVSFQMFRKFIWWWGWREGLSHEQQSMILLFSGATAQLGFRPPLFEVSRSHTDIHTHTPRIPLDEGPARRRSRYLHNTQQTQEKNIHAPEGFEPAIPAIKRLQTYALDRTATGIGSKYD